MKTPKNSDKVIDASALVAIFMGQPSARKALRLFEEAVEKGYQILIPVINWGEVLYTVEKHHGMEGRKEAEQTMKKMHLTVIDVDKDLTREAARLKATKKIPYADCFPAALSIIRNATLVTHDNDFRPIQDEISIMWL